MRPVFYLHGFASSPAGSKATWFADKLRAHGIELHRPDLNEPSFETMTVTRMLEHVGSALAREREPAAVIGSSLGGALAVLAAVRFRDRVERLVLLAPAVMLAKRYHHLVPPERVEEWRRRGALPFFHYGYNEQRLLNYTFHEDSLTHDAFEAAFDQPTLIFQGLRDTSVDYRGVEAFARPRSNVTLSLVDDDHQLTASLPQMWDAIAPFLGLSA